MNKKLRIRNRELVPESGGVLLTPNHVTYIDAFILSVATPRPGRFMMGREWYENRWIHPWAVLFGCISVSQTRAKDAIRKAVEALQAGDVVCIFPEGNLTGDGGLRELQRGYQMIAKKAGVPVLPARMSGLWGSAFSRAEGGRIARAIRTVLRGVEVEFSPVLDAGDANVERLEQRLERG